MMHVQGVTLTVRDLDRVARFYREVVGLAVLETAPGRVVLGVGDAALVELLHRPGALEGDEREAGLFHTAFLLPERADLGRWLAHAAALGQRLDGAADHLVSEAVYLRDPEGNGIEVYADRPRAEWRWTETAEGPRVTMANVALDRAGLLALAGTRGSGAPAGTVVGHVHLQVGDTAAATRFYAGQLGLDVTLAWPEAVFLSSGGYHHHLAANTWRSAGAGVRDPRRAGLEAVRLVREGAAPGVPQGVTEMADPWGTLLRFETINREG